MATATDVIQFAADDMEPVFVYNHDVIGLRNRLNRFICELIGSQSSGVSLTNSYDMARAGAYLDAIDKFHDWILGEDQLDLPESKGMKYPLEPAPVVPKVENEDLADLLRLSSWLAASWPTANRPASAPACRSSRTARACAPSPTRPASSSMTT